MICPILNDCMTDGANLTYFEYLIEFLTGYNYYFGAGYSNNFCFFACRVHNLACAIWRSL